MLPKIQPLKILLYNDNKDSDLILLIYFPLIGEDKQTNTMSDWAVKWSQNDKSVCLSSFTTTNQNKMNDPTTWRQINKPEKTMQLSADIHWLHHEAITHHRHDCSRNDSQTGKQIACRCDKTKIHRWFSAVWIWMKTCQRQPYLYTSSYKQVNISEGHRQARWWGARWKMWLQTRKSGAEL